MEQSQIIFFPLKQTLEIAHILLYKIISLVVIVDLFFAITTRFTRTASVFFFNTYCTLNSNIDLVVNFIFNSKALSDNEVHEENDSDQNGNG